MPLMHLLLLLYWNFVHRRHYCCLSLLSGLNSDWSMTASPVRDLTQLSLLSVILICHHCSDSSWEKPTVSGQFSAKIEFPWLHEITSPIQQRVIAWDSCVASYPPIICLHAWWFQKQINLTVPFGIYHVFSDREVKEVDFRVFKFASHMALPVMRNHACGASDCLIMLFLIFKLSILNVKLRALILLFTLSDRRSTLIYEINKIILLLGPVEIAWNCCLLLFLYF